FDQPEIRIRSFKPRPHANSLRGVCFRDLFRSPVNQELPDSRPVSAGALSPRGRVARNAGGGQAAPTGRTTNPMSRGAGSPHPALRATFSRREKDSPPPVIDRPYTFLAR